jgi:acyltransferase-like protein
MERTHIHFIDWMKSLGMLLIVYGHVAGDSIMHLTPPIYAKQLGVAFFIFVIGWGLARESRHRFQVVYNRLFPVFLLGLGFAIVLSAIVFLTQRDLNESNYLPFFLGINVLLDDFPANPTTWYIGTYIHMLLLWALVLHKVRVRLWMVGIAAVGEILFRSAMLDTGALFRTYMVLPNWATVFLLGMYAGNRKQEAKPATLPMYMLGLTVLLIAWTLGMRQLALDEAFPFRNFVGATGAAVVLVRSACVTFLYVAYSWLVFEVTRRLPGYAIIAFFARHTLFIFIAHMPLLFALQQPLHHIIPSYGPRIVLLMLILYPGLAIASAVVMRWVQPMMLRDMLWTLLSQHHKAGRHRVEQEFT